jgi:predicted nucleic acid-binding protein
MEQVAYPEMLDQDKASEGKRPLAFLDTSVIVEYLRGEPSAVQLFSAEAEGHIRFAINPIVLQELLLAGNAAGTPEFERIRDHLKVLPIDLAKAEALLPAVRALRNATAHPNDILMLSSADECDFMVTENATFKNLVSAGGPLVITPKELATQLRAA